MSSKRPNPGIVLIGRPTGHDETIPHTFNHTDGFCPKCSSKNHILAFCRRGQSEVPRITGCEVDGDHLHRQCAICGYPWIERCYDQLLTSQEEGWLLVESRLMATLAAVAVDRGGISLDEAIVDGYKGWTIRFHRNEEAKTITITAEPTPETGAPAHPEQRQPGPPTRSA